MNKQTTAPAETHDFLADPLANIIRFCKQNRKPLLAALVAVLIVTVGISLYVNHCKKVTEDSWAAYYQAQVAFFQQGEETGFKQLDDVAARFAGTPAAQYAQLFKADRIYDAENYAQAAQIYAGLTSSTNEIIRSVATLSQAAALQGAQNYPQSISVLQSFIAQNSKSFMLPQAYLTLALSQELAGNKAQALESYKYLLENYTQTYFGTFAKDKISELQK